MKKYLVLAAMVLPFLSACFADTFINNKTGESFNGFAAEKKRGATTLVRREGGGTEYIDLRDYEIQRNQLGRNSEVYSFSIENPVDITAEVTAFEKELIVAANRGPRFILIEIDSPGGRKELVKRICDAIRSVENSDVIAYIKKGEYGGANAEAITIALVCDKIYMQEGTNIGTREFSRNEVDLQRITKNYQGKEGTDDLQWQMYTLEMAQIGKRPKLLVRAMLDDSIQLLEVQDSNGKRFLIEANTKRNEKTKVLGVRCQPGEFLRLTADEAVRYGIADKVVVLRNDIVEEQVGAQIKVVQDKSMLAARRDFERIEKQVSGMVLSIRQLEAQAGNISEQIRQIDKDDYRSGPGYYFEKGGNVSEMNESYYLGKPTYEIGNTLNRREVLMINLSRVLQDTIRQYNRTIPLVRANPDVGEDPNALERGLANAQTRYNRVISRIRWTSY